MKTWLKRLWKEEKALTLIELLAVIVILAIVAAIAVPSISGIIGDTKQEAHRANATQLVEATKQYVAINQYKEESAAAVTTKKAKEDGTAEDDQLLAENKYMEVKLEELVTAGYFPQTGITDPESNDNSPYSQAKTIVYVLHDSDTNNYEYWVTLANKDAAKSYFEKMKYEDIVSKKANIN